MVAMAVVAPQSGRDRSLQRPGTFLALPAVGEALGFIILGSASTRG
jgi:hypothetical protein